MRRLPRVLPALLTPFTRRGVIDEDAHSENVAELARQGITGFVIGGSTGQGPYLEPGERSTLVAGARAARPSAYLMCGVNGETVRSAVDQAEEAAGAGADAALVLTPTTLVRNRHHLVRGFFEDVANASPIPVFLYSVPGVTGYELPLDVVTGLAEHANVIGMKDSGGHPARAADIVRGTPDDFLLVCGASAAVFLCTAAGAHGAVTASGNYAAALVSAARRSADAQGTLTTLTRVVEAHGVPGTMTAAALTGLTAGTPRRPLRSTPAPARRDIESALRSAGLAA